MSKDEKESRKESNIPFLNSMHNNPQGVEQLLSSYLNGFTRSDGKKIPSAGRNEIFYFNLGVPTEHLSQIYSKQESKELSTPYSEIPKYYRDRKGQLIDYNNAQELKALASEVTKVMEEIGQYASNNYSAASQAKLMRLYGTLDIRNLESLMAPERVEATVDVIKRGEFKNAKGQDILIVEPVKTYQEVLDTAKAALVQYKTLAKQLRTEPTVVYSSEVTISSEGFTKQILSHSFLKAICEQKDITGLDPKDPEFKVKLAKIDPKSLDRIELAFRNDTTKTIDAYKIDGTKFLEALKQIDPKTLPDKKFYDLKNDERVDFRKNIATQLEKAKLFEKGEITDKFKSESILLSKITKLKPGITKSKIKRLSFKNRFDKEFRSDKDKNIVFADRAQTVIMNDKLQAIETGRARSSSITQSSSMSTNAEQSQSKTAKLFVPEQTTQARDSLEGIMKLATRNIEVDTTFKTAASTLAPTPLSKENEELKQKLQTKPIITQESLVAKPVLKTSSIQTSRPELATSIDEKAKPAPRIVEVPVTKSGMKPLPPIPTVSIDAAKSTLQPLSENTQRSEQSAGLAQKNQAPSSTLGKKPLPIIPPQSSPLANITSLQTADGTAPAKNPFPPIPPGLAQILRGDGMKVPADQKTLKPSNTMVRVGTHRNNKDTHNKDSNGR